ncbi:MAG: hypothetical protein M1831_004934 [Alyxoria varia]|nr:MAG: hypothetical protein M1831_004934 [Alyxoria varia]
MPCDASARVDAPYLTEPKEAWLDDDTSGSDNDIPCHQSKSNVSPKIRNNADTFRLRSQGRYHEDAHFGSPPAYDDVFSILDQHNVRPLPANYSSVRTAPNSREHVDLGVYHNSLERCELTAKQSRGLKPALQNRLDKEQGPSVYSLDRKSRMRPARKGVALRLARKPKSNAYRQRHVPAAGELDAGRWSWKPREDAALDSSSVSTGRIDSLPSLRKPDEEQSLRTESTEETLVSAVGPLNTSVVNPAPSLVSGSDSWFEYMSQMENWDDRPENKQEEGSPASLKNDQSNCLLRATKRRKSAEHFSSPQPARNGSTRKVQAASWPLNPGSRQLYAAMAIASMPETGQLPSNRLRTDAYLYFASLQSPSIPCWNDSTATPFGKIDGMLRETHANKESARSATLMRLTGARPPATPTKTVSGTEIEMPQPTTARYATSRDVAQNVFPGDNKTLTPPNAESNAFTNLLHSAYGLWWGEPPLKPRHVRRCGARLHDDYRELQRGAARKLELELNRHANLSAVQESHSHTISSDSAPKTQTDGSSPSSSTTSPRSSLFSSTSSQGTSCTSSGDLSEQSPISPKTGDARSDRPPAVIPVDASNSQTPYLLTCAPEEKRTPKLAHLPVEYPKDIESDADVAWKLREHYERACKRGGGLLGKLGLRGVRGIEFVMFEVHANRFADIRARPNVPPTEPDYGYDFEPGHLVPPVGSNYLMHLYTHPQDYTTELILYPRLPKLLLPFRRPRTQQQRNERSSLFSFTTISPRNSTSNSDPFNLASPTAPPPLPDVATSPPRLTAGYGWGLELRVSLLPSRIWCLFFVIFIVLSLAVGVGWGIAGRGDLQSAAAVAGWIGVGAGVGVAWVESCLGG